MVANRLLLSPGRTADLPTGQGAAGRARTAGGSTLSSGAGRKPLLIVPGSINADLLFKVSSLPRPGETVLCAGYSMAPGGKGANQATAAAKAGAEVRFVGQVGDDAYGAIVRRQLEEAGIGTEALAVSTRPTGVAMIGVDARGENAIIVASGANLDTRADQVPEAWLGASATVLCQNEIRSDETFAAIRRAKAKGARTILNLAPAARVPDIVLGALDVLIVNEHEAATLAGRGGEPRELARALALRHRLSCVVTMGSEGALAVEGEVTLRVRPLMVDPLDTTGAGDSFAGVLAAWLDRGADLAAAMRAASVAAGLSCEKLGAQSAQVDRATIEARLRDLPPVSRL